VFGEASGAEALNNPATNLKISDTSVLLVKLLKYEPAKPEPQAFEVGTPVLILYNHPDWLTIIA
jgi:hypothetical protein